MPAAKKENNAKKSGNGDPLAEATEQGFIGVEVDPIPNSEYSLQSGPESPTLAEQQQALAEAEAKDG